MTMTDEAVKALLDGATPGPLFVVRQNEPPHIWIVQDPETWVHRCAAVPAYTDRLAEQEANAALYAAAPDLARAYLARGEELTRLRADAQAAVALVVERAAEVVPPHYFNHDEEWAAWRSAQHLIRALADTDGLAMVEALRKERDDADRRAGAMLARVTALDADAEAARARVRSLAADLAAAQAQIEALKAILHDAGALRDAADRVSEWFCTEARHLEGPRIQALRMAVVAYDRHMQPTALSVPNFSAGWPLEEGDGSIIVGAALTAKEGE